MLKVSVVIPTYNHSRFLRQAIDGALAQTFLPSEIIAVDDGSTDDTPVLLASYGNRIRVVRQQNQGVSAARNTGAGIATGDLLAFLDADDLWLPKKLERQVERFTTDPALGLVHCGTEDIDANGKSIGRHLDGHDGWVATRLLLFRGAVILGGGSATIVPRAVFNEFGGFDQRLSVSADWDFYYRIACRYRVGFVPEVLLQYRVHGTNMHGNIRAMEHNMLLAYDKAFSSGDPQLRRLRRRCYGNLHAVLAGSFFSAGEYGGFVRHTMKSLFLTPDNIWRFAQFPLRWRRRKLAFGKSPSENSTPEAVR